MIIDAMTTAHRNEYFRNLLEHHRLTLESVTEQRDVALQCHKWCYEDRKRIIEELATVTEQRDRMAEVLNDLWHHYSLTGAAYELIEKALAAVKGSEP